MMKTKHTNVGLLDMDDLCKDFAVRESAVFLGRSEPEKKTIPPLVPTWPATPQPFDAQCGPDAIAEEMEENQRRVVNITARRTPSKATRTARA